MAAELVAAVASPAIVHQVFSKRFSVSGQESLRFPDEPQPSADGCTALRKPDAMHTEMLAVAIGSFADPHFPAPSISVWEECRHPWVSPSSDRSMTGVAKQG
jgi:hypothetical protein